MGVSIPVRNLLVWVKAMGWVEHAITKVRKKLLTTILGTLAASTALAQPRPPLPKENYQIEFRQHYGFFYHHLFDLERFNGHFPAYELSFQRSTFGRHRWESLWSFPLIGISALYSPLGNFEPIGAFYALYPYLSFPLNHNVKSRVNFRMGVGLAYLTNKFHPRANPQNYAIGSHLNAVVNLFIDYRLTIAKRLNLAAGAGLTHFSNGSIKTPNYGLNYFSAMLAATLPLKETNHFVKFRYLPVLRPFEYNNKRKYDLELSQAFGMRDMRIALGERYLVSNTSINWLVPRGPKYSIGAGIDLTYDDSERGMLDRRGIINSTKYYNRQIEILKPGLSAIYEMRLSRLSFQFQVGLHLSGADKSDGVVFEKLGSKYYFYDPWFASIALTAHGFRADFIGYGIGYRIDRIFYRQNKNRWSF